MRLLLLVLSLLSATAVQCEEPVVSPFVPSPYPAGWATSEYHRLDAQLGEHSAFGLTLNPEQFVSEVRVSYAFGHSSMVSDRDSPFILQLTLRGWKLMETNLETSDTDYFEAERVRDRDIRKQWIMLSIVKSF